MRTPFTSVTAIDQQCCHTRDPADAAAAAAAAGASSSSATTKMQSPQQQQNNMIYHPNAVRQRMSSTTGFGGGSGHPPTGQSPDSAGSMEAGVGVGGGGGRRSRRASIDRRGSFSRRGSTDAGASPPVRKQQRFEIIRKLGSGTYGKVSLAMDHRTGEEVAVKVIKKSAIENTADLIRIRREIRIMSALKHPHIIEIKEVFENDEKIILVMEYASGGELYDHVSSHGPLEEAEVRRLFRQIVSAVYYCHKHGVAHRDLKLENILLDKRMEAKIADFGLSNYFKPHSLLHTFCGSPLYASPEIINGTPYRGPEVDCWSLGVLLYTLAYSSMPFDGRDFNRMIRQIKRGAYYEPEPPSSASTLIRSMLRVNPDRRADIDSVAGHWWLNYDQNLPSIATLDENQVLDKTPLYIRQETLMIQSLGEESEIFAEYTHLSESTRKKIEEFRRRKKEADWYLTDSQSPLKKSKKRSSSVVNEQQQKKRQSSGQISAGRTDQKLGSQAAMQSPVVVGKPPVQATTAAAGYQATPVPSMTTVAAHAPLASATAASAAATAAEKEKEKEEAAAAEAARILMMNCLQERTQYAQVMGGGPLMEDQSLATFQPLPRRPPSLVLKEVIQPDNRSRCFIQSVQQPELRHKEAPLPPPEPEPPVDPAIIDDANRLIDQLMEEALRGPVCSDTVEKIRSSEAYGKEQFVKEILEAVLVAQQPKPIASRSMYNFRTNRSRSKHSSMSRMPPSTSPSTSTTPLPPPDQQPHWLANQQDYFAAGGGETTHSVAGTPPPAPDVVASFNEDLFIAPSAQLTITLPHHKIIHQTVPEEAELDLAGSGSEVEQRVIAEEDDEEEEEEDDEDEDEEEDVYSTDFEDMDESTSSSSEDRGGDEEEEMEDDADLDDSVGSAKDETDIELEPASADIVPISTVDSCASLHSDSDVAPSNSIPIPMAPPAPSSAMIIDDKENTTTTVADQKIPDERTGSEQSVPPPLRAYRRTLSKRISRGKYERSKFTFQREISIQDSPRASRNRIGGVQPTPKEAPKLFQKAKQYILQYPDPERISPDRPYHNQQEQAEGGGGRRRRYSDGDKKNDQYQHQQQQQQVAIASIANPGAVLIFDKGPQRRREEPPAPGGGPAISCFDTDESESNAPRFFEDMRGADEDGMVTLSMHRRQERARERESIMYDYALLNGGGHYVAADSTSSSSVGGGGGGDSVITAPPSPQPSLKKRTYVTGGEAKAVGAAIDPSMLAVVAKTRRASAEPLLDILEAGGGQADEYDVGTAGYGMPMISLTAGGTTTTTNTSTNTSNNLIRLPSNSAIANVVVSTGTSNRYRPATSSAAGSDRQESHENHHGNHDYDHDPDENQTSAPSSPNFSSGTPPAAPAAAATVTVSAPTPTDHQKNRYVPTVTPPEPVLIKDDPSLYRPQVLPLHYGYTADFTGDRQRLMSPIASGYERNDDDYYNARSYAHTSYRSKSVFAPSTPRSREMSPAQRHSSAAAGGQASYDADPTSVYYYDSRRQKAKSWYTAGDRYGGSFEDALLNSSNLHRGYGGSSNNNSNKNNNNIGVANYFRSLFDVAYNRGQPSRTAQHDRHLHSSSGGGGGGALGAKRDREKTPVFLQQQRAGGETSASSASMKRRSRSMDKSAQDSIAIIPKRYHPPSRPPTTGYSADDRLDITSSPRSTSTTHHQTYDSNVGGGGGAGRFQTLLLNSGGISSSTATSTSSKAPSKGILKKQTANNNHYHHDSGKFSSGDTGKRPVTFMDRIRRHLSNEKLPTDSSSPSSTSKNRSSARSESTSPDSSSSSAAASRNISSSTTTSTSTSKKRSVLQVGRRRTTEAARIGYGLSTGGGGGNDSGFGSGSISSDEYSGHSTTTPIEKLKGFFTGGGTSAIGSAYVSPYSRKGYNYHQPSSSSRPFGYSSARF